MQGIGAIVTGGTSGIGRSIAAALLAEGASVVICGRDQARGREAEAELRRDGDAWFVAADALDEEAIRRSVDEAVVNLGRLDALVNCAGIARAGRLIETTWSEFERLLAVNLGAALRYTQACRPYLAPQRGSVVNIGSDAGLRGEQAIGAYSVSKAALVMASQLLALDLAGDGIRCNCVCPGATLPGMRHFGALGGPETGDEPGGWPLPPLGRYGSATDMAAAVLFFVSEESSFCTGATLLVDGGLQAGVPG